MTLVARGAIAFLLLGSSLASPAVENPGLATIDAPDDSSTVEAVLRSTGWLAVAPVEEGQGGPTRLANRPRAAFSPGAPSTCRRPSPASKVLPDRRADLRRLLPGRRTPRLAPTEPPRP